jgi:hypothetical protein
MIRLFKKPSLKGSKIGTNSIIIPKIDGFSLFSDLIFLGLVIHWFQVYIDLIRYQIQHSWAQLRIMLNCIGVSQHVRPNTLRTRLCVQPKCLWIWQDVTPVIFWFSYVLSSRYIWIWQDIRPDIYGFNKKFQNPRKHWLRRNYKWPWTITWTDCMNRLLVENDCMNRLPKAVVALYFLFLRLVFCFFFSKVLMALKSNAVPLLQVVVVFLTLSF